MKKILTRLFAVILACVIVTENNIPTQNVQAASKATKAIKHAQNTYYTTRKNLKKYKKVVSSGCTDYSYKNKIRLTIVRPKKDEILVIKGMTCEYYYDSNQKLVFAYAYKKVKGKRKEYRAYFSGRKCYRYIGPDKKVHTYKNGKNPKKASSMAGKLYDKGTYNLHFVIDEGPQ